MKNCSYICGVQTKNIILFAVAGILISALGEHCNLGLPISRDFCTAKYGNVLGRTGDSAALFPCIYYNFSYAMTKNVKNCGTANHSTRTSTSAHDTSIATIQLPVSNPYSIPCFEDFIDEARRHFEVEMNAKNKAYAFILSRGLLSEFTEFSRAYSGDCQSIESRLEIILKNC